MEMIQDQIKKRTNNGFIADWEIKEFAEAGMIDPFVPEKRRSERGISFGLDSCTYDLTLANSFKEFKGTRLDPTDRDTHGIFEEKRSDMNSKEIDMVPGCMMLARAKEYIEMPNYLFGLCFLKSTWGRVGIIMSTGFINPGWKGFLTLELMNPTNHTVVLYAGEGIVSVAFCRIRQPDTTYKGPYQDIRLIESAKTSK